jgi:hypothetical protein
MRHLAFLGLCLLVPAEAVAGPIGVELNFNTTRYRIDAATNAEVPIASNPFQSFSLAMDPSNKLYSADANGVVWNVTGGPIPVGPTLQSQIADLDYGNGGLWGFSNVSRELFFFDLGLGTVTYSQAISGTGALTMTGVAFDQSTGDVYLSGYGALNTDQLFVVNPFAATANPVGAMNNGDAFSYFSDIDFDAAGNLYAMSFYHRYFYTVSTSNAATSFVSAGPHRDTTAMALNPVPEPGAVIVLAAGLGGLLRRRRAS